jgi:predicted regulator of Ras-like GTPase activity (Roadblock/LC7/MglB family)
MPDVEATADNEDDEEVCAIAATVLSAALRESEAEAA